MARALAPAPAADKRGWNLLSSEDLLSSGPKRLKQSLGELEEPSADFPTPDASAMELTQLLQKLPCLFELVSSRNAARAAALTVVKILRTYPASVLLKVLPQVDTYYRDAEKQWRRLHSTLRGGSSNWSKAQLAPLLPIVSGAPPTTIVSIGCGETLLEDAELFRSMGVPLGATSTLHGIDVMPLKAEQLPPGVSFEHATAACTSVPRESVELAYMSNAMYNHSELQPTAQELISIVQPGRLVYVVQTFEPHLVDAMLSLLMKGGCGLVARGTDDHRQWVLVRKGAASAVPVPLLEPLKPRYETDADYTIEYEVYLPTGGVYVGSHCEANMLWEKVNPFVYWIGHRWREHHKLLLAGSHHSPKLQAEFDKTDSSWPLHTAGSIKVPEPTVSSDGLTFTYSHENVKVVATRRAPHETSPQAQVKMILGEQLRILQKAAAGVLLNASIVAGAVDLDGCSKGGRARYTPPYPTEAASAREQLAAAPTRTAEEEAELEGLEQTREADERAWADNLTAKARGGENGGANDPRVKAAGPRCDAAEEAAGAAAEAAAAAPWDVTLAAAAKEAEEELGAAGSAYAAALDMQEETSAGKARSGETAR